mmetsp:Transcript_977/g.3489  ORF Transcript_977/g.3489 Transcript_977/m.3489 type:complete len:451 (+) Transcript_977:60-1412(+)
MAMKRNKVSPTRCLSVAVAILAVLIGLSWPFDGLNKERYGITDPTFVGGWNLAPFGQGPNLRVLMALLMQYVPLESVQRFGCAMLIPLPSDPGMQVYNGLYLKGIDLAAAALRRFPESYDTQRTCIATAAFSSLFNPYTSSAAGRAGHVELALKAFRRWKADPEFQQLGQLGCFFDLSPANARRFAEADGVRFVHDVIKTHFNNTEVQFQAFCAYSSGCGHGNAELCGDEEGLIETMVQVMQLHRKVRVREEVMQVIKQMANASRLRPRLVEAGIVPQLVQVLQERKDSKTDQSVACEAMATLLNGHEPGLKALSSMNATTRSQRQAVFAREGALEQVVEAVDLAAGLTLPAGFGGQSKQALTAHYNVERSCVGAMVALALGNPENQGTLVRLGAPAKIAKAMRARAADKDVQGAGCAALQVLSEDNAANKQAVDAAEPPSCASFALRAS